MRGALHDLVKNCHGDDHPQCPILDGLVTNTTTDMVRCVRFAADNSYSESARRARPKPIESKPPLLPKVIFGLA